MLNFGNLINATMPSKFWQMRINIRIFKPVKLLLCCQSTNLLLTSLPVGPFWFSCSFLFISTWS